jgi:Xaa-Pro aminopeptidase
VFATTEQSDISVASRREEVARKLERVRSWLEQNALAGVVLAGVDAVAWLSAGLTTPIERGALVGPLRLVVTAEHCAALTTNVERPRLEAESGLEAIGIPLHEVEWYEPDGLERAAVELSGRPASELASDRLAGFACFCEDDFVALRLALSAPEQERLERLALDTAAALEAALAGWVPGERDRDLLARADEALERCGAFAACLIVGGDERVERYRHPLATGAPMHRLVMAVAVAERGGLHAAATRFASAGVLDDGVRGAQAAARAVEAEMLAASAAGSTYGEVMACCERAYAACGHPGAWREHYQGGPIGYRQREFELVPSQRSSRWFSARIEPGHALAWNPSLGGGGKSEDTYLVEPDGLRRLTDTGGWPLADGRPAILDIETGLAA